ncbi:hypothetical protein ACP0HM_05080 [Escherichia coli]
MIGPYAEFLKLVAELTDKGYNEADLAFATRGVVKAELAAQLKAANVQGFPVEGDKLVNRPILWLWCSCSGYHAVW